MIDGYAYGNVLQNVSKHFKKSYWDHNQDQRA
jgi:hypothetical protein